MKPLFPILIIASTALTAAAGAATLPMIPMQGAMTHIYLDFAAGQPGVLFDGDPLVPTGPTSAAPLAVPELRPLALSHPGDGFDPAAPWFSALDPGGDGDAFSRRWGFVAVNDNSLPEGLGFWVRLLELSPGLEVKHGPTWTPLFHPGPDESLIWRFGGTMFHPAFHAPALVASYSAAFELYLGDETGLASPNFAAVPFTLEFTAIPEPALIGLLLGFAALLPLLARRR